MKCLHGRVQRNEYRPDARGSAEHRGQFPAGRQLEDDPVAVTEPALLKPGGAGMAVCVEFRVVPFPGVVTDSAGMRPGGSGSIEQFMNELGIHAFHGS
jgi:hypothetical protein